MKFLKIDGVEICCDLLFVIPIYNDVSEACS